MQFPPGVAILPLMPSTRREANRCRGREAGRLGMIGSRGFRMVEPPRASSGWARIHRSLIAENRVPSVTGNWRRPRIAAPHRSRSPPGAG